MLERDLQRAVLDLCKMLGLRTAHFRTARTGAGWATPVAGDGAGFPDLVIVGSAVLFRELKTDQGRLSHDQVGWKVTLLGADANWAVWTPTDLRSGLVLDELNAIRKRGPR